jgi:ribonuclease HI
MAQKYLYTDGACSGNPGPGGWGSIIKDGVSETVLSGGERDTTNNRMELMAVIAGLEKIDPSEEIVIVTDSEYVKNGITKWIHSWLKNSWKTASKQPVKNKELWVRLWNLAKDRKIQWQWVRGHSGHPENEKCDRIARAEIARLGR